MKALIMYETMSGNTEEVAEIVEEVFIKNGIDVTMNRIGVGFIPSPKDFDIMLIGTYTWEGGSTPDEVKDTVADIGYKPVNVAVFGTGDTQFGGEALFCKAVDKLAVFYESPYPVLKIEQSPRGSQEVKVREWAEKVSEKIQIRV